MVEVTFALTEQPQVAFHHIRMGVNRVLNILYNSMIQTLR